MRKKSSVDIWERRVPSRGAANGRIPKQEFLKNREAETFGEIQMSHWGSQGNVWGIKAMTRMFTYSLNQMGSCRI